MAVRSPASIAYGTTHPTTAERFVGLGVAASEIERKRVAGLALEPEIKQREDLIDTADRPNPSNPRAVSID